MTHTAFEPVWQVADCWLPWSWKLMVQDRLWYCTDCVGSTVTACTGLVSCKTELHFLVGSCRLGISLCLCLPGLLWWPPRRATFISYTVTKSTHEPKPTPCSSWNEKNPRWCWIILYLAHTGILHSSMPEMSSGLRSNAFCRPNAGRFRKNLRTKISGKTARDSLHADGKSRT